MGGMGGGGSAPAEWSASGSGMASLLGMRASGVRNSRNSRTSRFSIASTAGGAFEALLLAQVRAPRCADCLVATHEIIGLLRLVEWFLILLSTVPYPARVPYPLKPLFRVLAV